MIPLSSGPVPATADAVIIGGGVNGLATARELAAEGMKNIVILEKNYIGSGSTGRCGGGIRQQWTTEENIRLAQESVALYENMSADLGYQVFFRQGGYLMITESEDDLPALRDAVVLQNRCDVPTEFLQPEECLKIVPDLDISSLKGATFCPKDGTAYPFAVVWGYARACHRAGVKTFIRTTVTGITADDGGIRKVHTDRGDIATGRVINCAGPWARYMASMVGIQLPNKQERHEIMVSESLKPFLDPMVISITNGIYFSQSLRGEIVGGIGDPAEPGLEDPALFDTRSQLRFAVRFAKALVRHYPRAAQVRMMRRQGPGQALPASGAGADDAAMGRDVRRHARPPAHPGRGTGSGRLLPYLRIQRPRLHARPGIRTQDGQAHRHRGTRRHHYQSITGQVCQRGSQTRRICGGLTRTQTKSSRAFSNSPNSNLKPAAFRTFGTTRWLPSSMPAISPIKPFRTKPGTGMNAGLRSALPTAEVNSFCRGGTGTTALTGPRISPLSRTNTMSRARSPM